ncbi:MAG: MoxR family ATPase [Saprospiraceae bacterium]|jgi:MoxR-like ATPase|nr:MoxR family ATPase [Saprospiraceae bacterium]
MNLKHTPDPNPQKLPARPAAPKFNAPEHYRPSSDLWSAVQTALHLGLPLLVTGEPGCGKTDLAAHIAWYYGLGEPEVFNAQTSSSVTDLFYRYDALRHFQSAQTQKELLSPEAVERDFIRYQALGAAIKSGHTCVVLIDEIDKAPRDLPNNVLSALEKLQFDVPETGEPKRFTFRAKPEHRPIIIMTSNSEKNLPDPFLRRVAYFHIEPPSTDDLIAIVKSKLEDFEKLDLMATVGLFEKIKKGDLGVLHKKPATAELLHWAASLLKLGVDSSKLAEPRKLDEAQRTMLATTFSVLAKTKEDLKTLKKYLAG